MEDVELEIRKMMMEAESGYNDGWTQKSYRDRLGRLRDILDHYFAEIKDIK